MRLQRYYYLERILVLRSWDKYAETKQELKFKGNQMMQSLKLQVLHAIWGSKS